MADQARYDEAKSQWIQAARVARDQKDKAKASYDHEKDSGLTNASSFEEWACQHYPSLLATYSSYQAAEANYNAAFQQMDSPAYQEWQKKRNDEFTQDLISRDHATNPFFIYIGEA